MNVFDLIAPHPDPLSIRLGASMWNDPDRAQAARDRRAVEVVGKAAYQHHFGAKGNTDRSAWLLREAMRKALVRTRDPEAVATEIGALVSRVRTVDTRLRERGYGTDRHHIDRFNMTIYASAILWFAAMDVACVVAHQAMYTLVFGGFLLVLVVYLTAVLAWMDGHRRAVWLGAAEAIQAESAALAQAERCRAEAEAPCDLTIALPKYVPGEGFLYVIQFSTGAVKVGMTEDPRRRIGEHRRDAEAFKVAITNFWLSPAHWNFRDNEVALINRCAEVSSRARREYFHEITFPDAVSIAAGLPYYTEHGLGASNV